MCQAADLIFVLYERFGISIQSFYMNKCPNMKR